MLLLERWTEPLAESNCYLLGEAGRAVVIDPNDPRGPLERLEALGWYIVADVLDQGVEKM